MKSQGRYTMKALLFLIPMNYVMGANIEHENSLEYLNQAKPGLTAEIFAPGIISKSNEHEFGSIFSKDGKTLFYAVDVKGKAEIRYTTAKGGKWTKPEIILSHHKYGFNDPFLSPDESKLYYISDRPVNNEGEQKDFDIWFSDKKHGGWSMPINAGSIINSMMNEYYISFTKNETMYFSSNKKGGDNYDIYSSKKINGVYQKPERLSESINSRAYEADVFIAPDESYIIFCSIRKGGFGEGDLYISFKSKDGHWTAAKNMGSVINSDAHELTPFVSHDGKYLFYTKNADIYWVSTKIINTLK